jgi:AmmeMemoRadiSam system protein B
MQRQPVVAGQFYPGQADELRRTVKEFLTGEKPPRSAIGMMVPHAGYVYSGAIAGQTFSRVEIPPTVVLLGPNHTGYGSHLAVFPSGSWATPLGEAEVNADLSARIIEECPGAIADDLAHRFEHSLEVQIPFIQVKSPTTRIVPVCVGHSSLDSLLAFGEALGQVVEKTPGKVLLVGSSDMTHYESAEKARDQDMKALKKILELDSDGLYHLVLTERISMCGVFPMVVLLAAAQHLGAKKGTLVHYGNSGDVTGDRAEVVGYAGVIID